MNIDSRIASTAAPATRSDFTACVDRCVRALIDGSLSAALAAQTQLRRWLGDDAARLADGSPIDYALFDDAILSVQERVAPAAGAQGLGQLLRAARQVAETIYARAPRKTVASEENLRVAGAQEPECTQMYMRIPSTAGAQIIERSRFFEVPARNRLP